MGYQDLFLVALLFRLKSCDIYPPKTPNFKTTHFFCSVLRDFPIRLGNYHGKDKNLAESKKMAFSLMYCFGLDCEELKGLYQMQYSFY